MSLTPKDGKKFINLQNQIADTQLDNAVDKYAKEAMKKQEAQMSLPELQKRVQELEAKLSGHRNYWKNVFYPRYWNPALDRIEEAVGDHILGDPLENYVVGGGFKDWNVGVTLPDGWTATGTATLSRVTRRTGARLENYACRITTAGATGGISQALAGIQMGNSFTLGFWLSIPSGDSVTVDITTAGSSGTNLAYSYTFTATQMGAGAWFALPSAKFEGWNGCFEPPADATSCTITFTAGQNSAIDVSDVQVVIGPVCDPNVWAPHPGDFGDTLPQALATTDSPEFNAVTLDGTTPLVIADASNGGSRKIVKVIEEVTISAAGTGTTFTLTLPAYSKVLRISSYVRVTVPAPATQITGIVDALGNNFLANVASYAPTAGNSDVGNRGCPYYVDNASAQTVQIIMDFTPATNAGRIRVVAEYETITPPTS